MARWLVALALATTVLLQYRAAAACDDGTLSWVERCAETEGLELRVVHCPAQRLVLSAARPGERALGVDISLDPDEGFRRVGGFGVSPVGEFPSWAAVAPPLREAFDGVARCLAADASLGLRRRAADRRWTGGDPGPFGKPATPWRLLAGLLLALPVLRRVRPDPRLAAVFFGTLVVRWALAPWAFFVPNGHGPEWVQQALLGNRGDAYGPGYHELFHGVTTTFPAAPDVAVFWAQALLGATAVTALWVLARALGARRMLAGALCAVLAIDPVVIRVCHSESYLATCSSLLWIAAAVLVVGCRRSGPISAGFLVAAASAGLLVSQTAAVHPVSWLACAGIPLVAVAVPGRLRTRLAQAVASGAIIGAVVSGTALPAMLAVLFDGVGKGWAGEAIDGLTPAAWMALVALAAGAVVWRHRALLIAAWGVAFGTLAVGGNVLDDEWGFIQAAYYHLYAPVAAAVLVAVLTRTRWERRWRRAVALGIVAAGAAISVLAHESVFTLPTEAREMRWAMSWRSRLPPGAVVAYLRKAGLRTMTLPLYGEPAQRGLFEEEVDVEIEQLGRDVFYYRSALCTTEEGAPLCDRIERRLKLERVDQQVMAARGSTPFLPLGPDPVTVVLFRIEN